MVLYHGDDYGINEAQAKRMLLCSRVNEGMMDSVSIMPNSRHLSKVISMLAPSMKKGIHINLAEGLPCANPEEIPLLVKDGKFYHSFFSLFWLSIVKRKELKNQVSTEILSQIKAVTEHLDADYKIRIDSHIHYHMIPVVFHGMCEALQKCGYEVEYIRYPDEKLSIYLGMPLIWHHIHLINLMKALVLKFFGIINHRSLVKYGFASCRGLFFGVMFTNKMYGAHVLEVLKKYIVYAEKKNLNLEVLFHPGGINGTEEYLEGCNDSFLEVYRSENRGKEAGMLKMLRHMQRHSA